ncbi:MAG: signal recognition particle-docking protein FtsY [Proteobacteria bacterium]|nr:signal recognition particle-docking protein FtsY [Pseudomonadota bacterium]MBU1417349.1 signal recognition particle-docking protein FtsY [Pseudomonadota bacterium]MBU1455302.1 signal recognition particle-docking protein FtsY [Pseudomonadota bacterium]
MLGWFKKKFAKKENTPSCSAEELAPESAVEKDISDIQSLPEETVITGSQPDKESDAVLPEITETPESITPASPSEAEVDTDDIAIAVSEQEEQEEQKNIVKKTTPPPAAAEKNSMFQRLSKRLAKTKESLVYRIDTLFLGKKEINAELFDELEEILITADLGYNITMEILDDARKQVKRRELSDPLLLRGVLKEKLRSFILESNKPAELVMPESGPFVIMVVGVNGVGKTTTIGKITNKFKKSGQSVLLAAADTFRAAAVAQLKIWGDRNGVEVISHSEGADPSAVVFDAMDKAIADNYDVLIVDTAGRLHTQVNLMEELKKIKRVMGKRLEGAPHEVLLVLDATTGQNGVSQANLFNETVSISGLALTKLDGTAKGGIVVNVCRELKIPIRFIGIGEQIDDLRDFDPDEFINALFAEETH